MKLAVAIEMKVAEVFDRCCFCAVNVGEDCPVFDGLYEFCQLSTGGSLGIRTLCPFLFSDMSTHAFIQMSRVATNLGNHLRFYIHLSNRDYLKVCC